MLTRLRSTWEWIKMQHALMAALDRSTCRICRGVALDPESETCSDPWCVDNWDRLQNIPF